MTLIAVVRRTIGAPKSSYLQLGLIAAAVVTAGGLRWFIDRGTSGVPFVTFVPVVLLAAVFLEWRFAAVATLASLTTAFILFREHGRFDPGVPNAILSLTFTLTASFMIVTGHVLRQTILELDAQSRRIATFNAELHHRTKNMLHMVRALASRASRSTEPVEFYRSLACRLNALAKANELLGLESVNTCQMRELVGTAMKPFPESAIDYAGPPSTIGRDPGLQLMMALHELGTNAMKYGALSVDGGSISIRWMHGGEGEVVLCWKERGGPPARPPGHKGLGSRMLTPGGAFREVTLNYQDAGLVCRIVVSAAPS